VGASKRTLVRLFPLQTGMTFREWRQQRRLLYALELLMTGANVTSIALETGYDNSSAFIAMFRRCLGTTPKRYMKTTRN
jgi:AraC-like DNA-binding protein